MQITVTFRGVEPTPALRTYAEDKLERVVRKYLRRPGDAHVILSVAKSRHAAEITLQADHVAFIAKETTNDLYSAIDQAIAKLAHQAQRLKSERSERKGRTSPRAVNGAAEESPPRQRAAVEGPGVVRERLRGAPLPVGDAVARLERSGEAFLVFNQEGRGLSVLYRRPDGRFGLIEGAR
jgi:putative sigma-54 modulation protein